MNLVKSLSLVPVVVFAMTSPALCQDAPAPAGPPRAYLTALGGAALNMDFKNPASVFAVDTESACTMTSWHTRTSTTCTI